MNRFDSQRRRSWQQERRLHLPNMNTNATAATTGLLCGGDGGGGGGAIPPASAAPMFMDNPNRLQAFPGLDDDLVSTVVPPVTVVLEGRSICQRISLHKHASYQSLARALRQMFVDGTGDVAGQEVSNSEHDLDLSNAVPGHLIAYEDMENDLLLAGDLNWKDFVRVAKRIRILPVKGNSRKGRDQERHS